MNFEQITNQYIISKFSMLKSGKNLSYRFQELIRLQRFDGKLFRKNIGILGKYLNTNSNRQ